jgi:hypothetical protein
MNPMTTISFNDEPATVAAEAVIPPAPAPKAPVVRMIDDRTASVRDSKGRLLTIKRLSVIEKMRFAKALGEHNGNDAYSNFGVVAASVREIDGSPVVFPMTNLQLEALVQRLDDPGMEAALIALISVSAPAQQETLEASKN